jgi:hypothetical protein
MLHGTGRLGIGLGRRTLIGQYGGRRCKAVVIWLTFRDVRPWSVGERGVCLRRRCADDQDSCREESKEDWKNGFQWAFPSARLEWTSAIRDALGRISPVPGRDCWHTANLAIDRRIVDRNTECSSGGRKMTEQTGGRFENIGRKVDEHFGGCSDRLEDDVKRVITFLNDKVVPEVRENSSKALRIAAVQLERLADHLDRSRKA